MHRLFIKIISFLIIFTSCGYLSAQESEVSNSLEKDLFSENDPQKKMDILIELTNINLSSNPDQALEYANQTVTLATEYNNQKNKLRAWLQLGIIYVNKADFRASLEKLAIRQKYWLAI